MKTKYAKETLQAFRKLISRKKTLLKNFGLIKEQNIWELSKKFRKNKNIEGYSKRSETKAEFAERAIRSLKHIIYRYIEEHDEKFIHKLPQLVATMNFRINRSIGKSSRDVKILKL